VAKKPKNKTNASSSSEVPDYLKPYIKDGKYDRELFWEKTWNKFRKDIETRKTEKDIETDDREKEWQKDSDKFITKRAKDWEKYADLHKKLDEGKIEFKFVTKKQKETILDGLVLASVYQHLLDQSEDMLEELLFVFRKIEKAGEPFKYRATRIEGFDQEKAMKFACTEMGWIESGKGKRDMLSPHEGKILIDLYEFSIRNGTSKAERQEAIESIYDLFKFPSPGQCARYLRKLGVKNVPHFQ